ncbi:2804_t:CDS:2, partial [Gigaspora rosea]
PAQDFCTLRLNKNKILGALPKSALESFSKTIKIKTNLWQGVQNQQSILESALLEIKNGSLFMTAPNEMKDPSMRAAWVQVNENETQLLEQGVCRTRNWPSSTKLELLAILMALYTVSKKKMVKIFTDSELAIAGIQGEWNSQTNKWWSKQKNSLIISRIVELTSIKDLKVELNKIERHSENRWNDMADRINLDGKRKITNHSACRTAIIILKASDVSEDEAIYFQDIILKKDSILIELEYYDSFPGDLYQYINYESDKNEDKRSLSKRHVAPIQNLNPKLTASFKVP